MWRPGVGMAALITMVGVHAGPPLTRVQQTGLGRSPSNLEASVASGPELNLSRGLEPLSLPPVDPAAINLVRAGEIGSEPPQFTPRPAPRPALLIGMYVSYGLLQALDAESTVHALQTKKAREGNPALSPFASNPGALAAFKVGLTGGTIFGIDRLRKSHPKLAIVTLGVINAGYACVVVRTYRNFSGR